MRKQIDFISDGAGEVGEGFTDIGRVVVGFVTILRCHAQQFLVNGFEGVDTFFELDVVGRELSLDEGVYVSFRNGGIGFSNGERW